MTDQDKTQLSDEELDGAVGGDKKSPSPPPPPPLLTLSGIEGESVSKGH